MARRISSSVICLRAWAISVGGGGSGAPCLIHSVRIAASSFVILALLPGGMSTLAGSPLAALSQTIEASGFPGVRYGMGLPLPVVISDLRSIALKKLSSLSGLWHL